MPAVNATINALKAAGVVFVPFDSGSFTDVANIAWAGEQESDNYMEPETTARYAQLSDDAWKHTDGSGSESSNIYFLLGFEQVRSVCHDSRVQQPSL